MFCKKCGKEIMDGAVICIHCGCAADNLQAEQLSNAEDKVNAGIIVGTVFIPLIGVIMGIVNLAKKKSKSGGVYLGVGIGCWILNMIISSIILSMI